MITLLSCVFPPEPLTSARTSADIAEELTRLGQAVTVLAPFPSRPAGRLYPGFQRSLYRHSRVHAGYEIVHCFAFTSPRSSWVSRALENISFGITSALWMLFSPRPDILYVNTWPLLATAMIVIVAQLRKIPFILSIQDLYPESLVIQGRLPEHSWLYKRLLALDRWITRRAQRLVVISGRLARSYREGRQIPAERICTIPNWFGFPENSDSVTDFDFRSHYQIPRQAFLCAYAGNIGDAAGVETLIQAFQYLRDAEMCYLLVAGQGSNLAACRALVEGLGLQRVIFHAPWAQSETLALLSCADALILPTRGSQSYASMPSKLISYLTATRPVIALAYPETELADQVLLAGCGYVIPPDQPQELAQQIRFLMQLDPHAREKLGQNGWKYAQENLSRSENLTKIVQMIQSLVAGQTP